eukprot:GHVT01042129.1.p1 GENE.GHVT01042129.1~~GHVT01042129.1.p1  ORF type:complete len:1092 (-),score=273.96 GHVT01042129.1:330-3425(-)
MAIAYPFELDDFQKRAVVHLENRRHVFVAAHTSAGKTVVAEYAMALALSRGQRAIYTSPVKALSNQKFRDFQKIFPSLGIVTGDVSVNPDARCLIVTTEILRSLLYRNDSVLDDLGVVIFDEVHYIADLDRGVVWEEVIIMLASSVTLVMLSATIPNYLDFADWIGRTKGREVFAMFTKQRPTPLHHYLYIHQKKFLLMDAKSNFNGQAYNDMYKFIREKLAANSSSKTPNAKAGRGRGTDAAAGARGRGAAGGRGAARGRGAPASSAAKFVNADAKAKTETHRLQALLREMEKESGLPAVVFCFSRRKVEQLPRGMPKLDLVTSGSSRSKIHLFVKQALGSLSEVDRQLPQVQQVVEFVLRGLGIHHGGLLPILKEMVEILFQRGLLRVLFATETFAMGVNMPAKSVVFTQIEKHDGQKVRSLLASEYTQMAGRAGRRGIDKFGEVFIFCPEDEPPGQRALTNMMIDKATAVTSQFRVTYLMLLQLCARDGKMHVEDMMAKSFREANRAIGRPSNKKKRNCAIKALEALPPIECVLGVPSIEEYVAKEVKARGLALGLHKRLWQISGASLFSSSSSIIASGRACILYNLPFSFSPCPAVLVAVDFSPLNQQDEVTFCCLVLLPLGASDCDDKQKKEDKDRLSAGNARALSRPSAAASSSSFSSSFSSSSASSASSSAASCRVDYTGRVATDARGFAAASGGIATRTFKLCRDVPLSCISMICNLALQPQAAALANDLKDKEAASNLALQFDGFLATAADGLSPFALTKPLKCLQVEFYESLLKQSDLFKSLQANKCHSCWMLETHFETVIKKKKCEGDIEDLNHSLRPESMDLYQDMKKKMEVLKVLKFIDHNEVPTVKGRVARHILTCNELTLVELLFQNILKGLKPEEAAAILSAFVFPDKCDDEVPDPTCGIKEARTKVEEMHYNLYQVQKAMGVRSHAQEFWRMCNFKLSLVAFEWARGTSLADIMRLTSVQEGSIVRAILRLDDLLRKVKQVAVMIGDASLTDQMTAASLMIRRDIIFLLSLYIQ